MSEHGHGGASEAHADHHYEYDGKPADEPGPDEPATPGWLTLLGISLVLAVMLGYIATRPDGKTRAELTATGTASAAPNAEAPPNTQPAPPNPARPVPSGVRPALFPSALASGARPVRPPGQFGIHPGGAGNAPPPSSADAVRMVRKLGD